jgi:hypothetical protein
VWSEAASSRPQSISAEADERTRRAGETEVGDRHVGRTSEGETAMEIGSEKEAIQKAQSEEPVTFWKRLGQRVPVLDLFPRWNRSKHQPHQGAREIARRRRQTGA